MNPDENSRRNRTWIFPFAQTVLRYEKLLDPKDANMAKNRCGEANQGDVAAMTEADIKRAKFYIVDVSIPRSFLTSTLRVRHHRESLFVDGTGECLTHWDETQVGEDQVLKEAKLAALTQEKEHAMIIESVNERLKVCNLHASPQP